MLVYIVRNISDIWGVYKDEDVAEREVASANYDAEMSGSRQRYYVEVEEVQ